MMVVGLTGGIGSGKSTAAAQMQALGAGVVDTDEIARHLTAADGAAMRALRETFGPGLVAADGSLDRAAMRALAFTDACARARLEAVLHPAIRARAESLIQESRAPYVLLVVPLLFETRGFTGRVARTLVVDCPEWVQAERTAARSGLAADEVRRIMQAQWPRWRRLQMADDVIWNGGDAASLQAQCKHLHHVYLGNAGTFAPQSGPTQRGVR